MSQPAISDRNPMPTPALGELTLQTSAFKAILRALIVTITACFVVLSAAVLPATAAQPTAQRYIFIPVDYPGALSTTVWAINSQGDMVGSYENPANFFHGFVYRKGKFTTIDGPGAAFTQLRGINDDGDIVGTFITLADVYAQVPGGGFQGLVQMRHGPLTVLKVPNHINTILHSIASNGRIYGCYHDEGIDDSPQDSMHGITGRLDHWPNLQFTADGTTMNVGGDAAGNDIVGQWYDHNPAVARHRGYVIHGKERVNFDVPGSNLTISWGGNLSGSIVGVWGDSTGHPNKELVDEGLYHGFLRDVRGGFTSIDFPASIDTKALGINNDGDIVGSYTDAKGKAHGFVAERSNIRNSRGRFAGDLGAEVYSGDLRPIDADKPLQRGIQAPTCHQTPKSSKY